MHLFISSFVFVFASYNEHASSVSFIFDCFPFCNKFYIALNVHQGKKNCSNVLSTVPNISVPFYPNAHNALLYTFVVLVTFLLSLRRIWQTPTAMKRHDSCSDRLQHVENMQPTSSRDELISSSTDQLCFHSLSCHFKVLHCCSSLIISQK
jgi:hypothetical protein